MNRCFKDLSFKSVTMADDEPVIDSDEEVPDSDEDVIMSDEEDEELDPETALAKVLRTALYHDGLARGLKESVKALDRKEAHLCLMASSCSEPTYTKLITALCKEHSIPMINVENSKQLGEWAGLCKYNAEGKAVNVVGASCVVIKTWGEETKARTFIMDMVNAE